MVEGKAWGRMWSSVEGTGHNPHTRQSCREPDPHKGFLAKSRHLSRRWSKQESAHHCKTRGPEAIWTPPCLSQVEGSLICQSRVMAKHFSQNLLCISFESEYYLFSTEGRRDEAYLISFSFQCEIFHIFSTMLFSNGSPSKTWPIWKAYTFKISKLFRIYHRGNRKKW